jgi:hypothetical protein
MENIAATVKAGCQLAQEKPGTKVPSSHPSKVLPHTVNLRTTAAAIVKRTHVAMDTSSVHVRLDSHCPDQINEVTTTDSRKGERNSIYFAASLTGPVQISISNRIRHDFLVSVLAATISPARAASPENYSAHPS